MKISQVCAVALVLVVGSVMAFADGIDPKVIINGVNSNSDVTCPPSGCEGVGTNFTFAVPKRGSGTLYFTNTSGVTWTSLALIETGHQIPASAISCSSNLFSSCTEKALGNGNVEILLSAAKCGYNKGIQNGQSFSIKFARDGAGSWPGGLSFSGHANVATVPEPGTIALMVTGLGALVSRRKMWKNRLNS